MNQNNLAGMSRMKKFRWKRWLYFSFAAGAFVLLLILLINYQVDRSARGKIYSDISSVPAQQVALVLGTSRYLTNGNPNLYFSYRIDAAVALYKAGKVKKILVSGDNSHASYNEPREMFEALAEKGVAPNDIYLDYAGFRTFDSMVRAHEVFGLDNFIVVSQPFHCERAIYIARAKNIHVTAYAAQDPYLSYKTMVREYPARVNAFLDCYVFRTQPHFLGEKIPMTAGL